MTTHTSASVREETRHANRTTRTATIINALKRRAQALLNDESIDTRSRAIIRYALETNDPWLARLVRQADAGERIAHTLDFSQPPESNDDGPGESKIESLAEIICRAGDESAAALFVLMGTLENSPHPKAHANTAKHFAFTRCSDSNLYGLIDSQLSFFEAELLSRNAA